MDGYLARFTRTGHRHSGKVADISGAVLDAEKSLFQRNTNLFIQGHGDFHPKNVIIGQDIQDNRSTLFVAAIDFESSMVMPQAFDVGCFLSQFHNQFLNHPLIISTIANDTFLEAYMEASGSTQGDFIYQVELFRARTNLSIAAYLVKLGLGESPDVWRLLVEAEQALTHIH
jgi:aminoglycoside phosphotransferase (APT) family kinase protein